MLTGPIVLPASGGKPKQLVVLLHGLGASGDDLIGLAPGWQKLLPDALFTSPNAPERCDMAPPGYGASYQWFSLREWTLPMMLQGVQAAAPAIDAYLDALMADHNLPPDKVALVGFSQGTMMALHVAPRRLPGLAGVVGYSGVMVGTELMAAEARTRPPVLLVHGALDTVMPFPAMGYTAGMMKKAGFDVETLARPMLAHGIDDEGMHAGGEFLQRVLRG